MKIQNFGVGQVGGRAGGRGQGGCERRSEVFMKIQKNKLGGSGWGGGGVRGQDGWGVGSEGEGVRVDMNGEVKFL